jgi:integrase
LHKASGRAVVTLNGRDVFLGKHGSIESRQRYARLIAEWTANDCQERVAPDDLTIVELVAQFWTHAQNYYKKPDGTPSSELSCLKQALRPLLALYGDTLAKDFGPKALKAVRGEMIRLEWVRKSINKNVGRLKHIFRWATSNELIPPAVYQAIVTVDGLKAGRSKAKEGKPVKPVPEAWIDAVLPRVSRQVSALIELQLLTGMRPGEACAMRRRDIDTSGDVWIYRPEHHKTEHHGHERVIALGPKAIELIRPFLKPDLDDYLFSPADAERERRESQHAARKTPIQYGNSPGTNRRRKPDMKPGAKYRVDSYRRAISRACDEADQFFKGGRVIDNSERIIGRWHPHRLRHSASTWLRKRYGIEAAKIILGHKHLSTTEIYAERDLEAAKRIMAQIG